MADEKDSGEKLPLFSDKLKEVRKYIDRPGEAPPELSNLVNELIKNEEKSRHLRRQTQITYRQLKRRFGPYPMY